MMQDDAADDLIALYRNAARDIPDDKLDRAILGKARAVAWRRRHLTPILAAGACILLAMGLSFNGTSTTPSAMDTAHYGLSDGRAQLYAATIPWADIHNGQQQGMQVQPLHAANDQQSGDQR